MKGPGDRECLLFLADFRRSTFYKLQKKIRLWTHYNAFNFGWGGGVGGWGAPLIEFGDEFAPVFLLA